MPTQVYEMQCVGQHVKAGDMKINVCKTKALTNMRASGSDKKVSGLLTSTGCTLAVMLRKGPLCPCCSSDCMRCVCNSYHSVFHLLTMGGPKHTLERKMSKPAVLLETEPC
jgi:hypothetical protein